MATVAHAPQIDCGTAPTVRDCYDLMTVAPACDIMDFTDGKYLSSRNDRAAYQAAQELQAEYLLDQAGCQSGTRLLDIGCGYGRILEHARRRGTNAVGITISPPQVESCRSRGLDVRELNYRHANNALPEWEHAFDAIIANGSLEHFVQAEDAAAGRSDDIYEELFSVCHQLLVREGRFVTTAIHFSASRQFDAAAIARGPRAYSRGSAEFQYAMLVNIFGGWYPEPGQLKRCASEYFELIHEEDGTLDYHLTSEYWFRRFRWALLTNPRVWLAVARQLREHPGAAWRMLQLQIWDQSWAWQFRPPAPMRLWRQTWQAK